MLIPLMAPSRTPTDARRAPSSGSGVALRLPGAHEPPPYHDERLVRPETREEMVRGHLVHALPANPEHGDEHTELTYVMRGNLARGYIASTDLLTHAGPDSDFATDTCIRRAGIDPRTSSRYLEEVAFEVVNEQSVRSMIERAEELTLCGVRRVFAIFVKKGEISEWSPTEARFVTLDPDAEIEDPTLSRPLPARALLDAAEADDAVARALVTKDNPVIAEVRAEGRAEGLATGLRRGRIEATCNLLGIPVGPREHEAMDELDHAGLDALLAHLESERRWP
jgi:hypothetical protein